MEKCDHKNLVDYLRPLNLKTFKCMKCGCKFNFDEIMNTKVKINMKKIKKKTRYGQKKKPLIKITDGNPSYGKCIFCKKIDELRFGGCFECVTGSQN